MRPRRLTEIAERFLRDLRPEVRPDLDELRVSSEAQANDLWRLAGYPDLWDPENDVSLGDLLDEDDYSALWNFAGCPDVMDVDRAASHARQAWDAYWVALDRLEAHLRDRARRAFLGTADIAEAMQRLAASRQSRPFDDAPNDTHRTIRSRPTTCSVIANAPPTLSIPTGAAA